MAVVSTDLNQATALLRAGELVAIPTETVYGLAADAQNPTAVARIFSVKGRPINHPLIVHIAKPQQLTDWATNIPDSAYLLANAFWPGPLTLVLKRHADVPAMVSGGQNTIGLRCPSHPLTQALLQQFGGGLAAPSANRFGRISPTCAAHVLAEFGNDIALIIDGGHCNIGLESTIVGLSNPTPELLRPGGIAASAIEQVLGCRLIHHQHIVDAGQQVPGLLASHYAPHTPLIVAPLTRLIQLIPQLTATQAILFHQSPLDNYSITIAHQPMPVEQTTFAQQLYATLRHYDDGQYQTFLVEAPPQHAAWLAINDRLRRASQQWLADP